MGEAKKFKLHLLKIADKRKKFENAEANSGNQGLFADGEAEGCQVRQDQEEQGKHQVQGAMQPLPLHFGGSRSRKGGEAEAISPSRTRRQGTQVDPWTSIGHGHPWTSRSLLR